MKIQFKDVYIKVGDLMFFQKFFITDIMSLIRIHFMTLVIHHIESISINILTTSIEEKYFWLVF